MTINFIVSSLGGIQSGHSYTIKKFFENKHDCEILGSRILLKIPINYKDLQQVFVDFSKEFPNYLQFSVPKQNDQFPYSSGKGNIYWWRNNKDVILIRNDSDIQAVKKFAKDEIYLYAVLQKKN